ncbi:AIG1 domain protein [Rhizoctonia solani 123E]|uniref:AIG1 domain protein n=1 Tax=Rhizoctonia solani 123E TaxID=1423351 RepID=A0A074SVS0_9AGAM|nr:AIG1 domain protein [Rhizoctonia solani 123E]
MYADKLEEEGAAILPSEPHRPHAPDEQPNSPTRDRPQKHTPAIDIMHVVSNWFLGLLINIVSGDNYPVAKEGTGLCTTSFRITHPFTIGGRSFRLIDSPGFHTTSLSDSDIMKKLIVHLVKYRDSKGPPNLSGILYLHPAGKDTGDEKLKGTMEALRHLVGDPWLSSITIAVISDGTATESDAAAQLQDPTSAFYSLHSGGAKILPLTFELPSIQEILLGIEPGSSQPRFYSKISWNPYYRNISGLHELLEEITGARAGRSRKITFEESESSRQQLQSSLDATETELKLLRSQLEQTQQEYASLRSELQLHDNTEQSKIVQSLQDLNRTIDDFGRSVAEYMVDTFAGTLNKDDPTTLDASNVPELRRQFGHQEGSPSLVASLGDQGLPIEDFIDLALRNFLCQNIASNVFSPFHPTTASSAEPNFMASLYDEVRRQGQSIRPPVVAAKWRACSFMALSKGSKLDKPVIGNQVENLIKEDIQPLLNNLFGQGDAIALTEAQRGQLQDVITVAWELNHVLKGEVVTLGDFVPLCCERGVPFDSKTMVEFEANKKRKPGSVAICTVRLGLTLSHAKGAGKDGSPSVPKDQPVDVPILILGTQGCGKSSFINAALNQPVREISNGYEPATKTFHYHGLLSGNDRFMLVDSPGFDNTSMSDGEVFTKLIQFLCCGKSPAMIAGVIYLHSQDTRLGSGVLKKNLYLIKQLLGDSFMERLTILLVPRPGEQADHQKLVGPLLDPKSPFYALYYSGAQVNASALETQPIRNMLHAYKGKAPVPMSVQNELCRPSRVTDEDIHSYLIKCARAREGGPTITGPTTTRPRIVAGALSQIQTQNSSSTLYKSADIKKLQFELEESKRQTEGYSTQLQQHLGQYAALCSQLQIHENLEQKDIVQSLIDLNRHIDDFALSVSQHLGDTYGGPNITTTRHAFHLPQLKKLFNHEEGKASLVQSSKGEGMPLEDFLDVAIRSILCEQLYKRIFAPFHPGLDVSDPRNGYIVALYARIRETETQATLGRWRTASFNAVSGLIGQKGLSQLKSKAGHDILTDHLIPMFQYLFGPNKNVRLKDAHVKDLSELVAQAWDWCLMLKEKVVLLGDFRLAAYRYGHAFDHALMAEFEPRRGGPSPDRILSTIGLGLTVHHGQSSGGGFDQATLCKASVVTEGWFERS